MRIPLIFILFLWLHFASQAQTSTPYGQLCETVIVDGDTLAVVNLGLHISLDIKFSNLLEQKKNTTARALE